MGRLLLSNALVLPILVVLTLAVPGSAQPVTAKNCTDCHPEFKKKLSGIHNHPPFEENNCMACHRYHGYRDSAEVAGRIIDVCSACHGTAEELPLAALHYPLREENSCLECHLPHSAGNKHFLKLPGSRSCLECHESPADASGTIHSPYADTACVTCHNPHGSLFGKSLVLPAGYICVSCHETILEGRAPPEMHTGDDIRSCENCHGGHYTETRRLLINPVRELCNGCHAGVAAPLGSKQPHTIVAQKDCLTCHVPHFRKGGSSLVRKTPELCLTCHEEVQVRLGLKYPHEVAADDCGTCHDPHIRLTPEGVAPLCLGCHDGEDREFLARHLGRVPSSCVSCHDPHGSERVGLTAAFEHGPFAERECDLCHENRPSASDLRDDVLCLECHDPPEPIGSHGPKEVSQRVCIDCHSPHAGRNPNLLVPSQLGRK